MIENIIDVFGNIIAVIFDEISKEKKYKAISIISIIAIIFLILFAICAFLR